MATEKERITFNLDQQVKVDGLMDVAFSKGLQKGLRSAQAEIEKLKHEIANLKLPWYRRI